MTFKRQDYFQLNRVNFGGKKGFLGRSRIRIAKIELEITDL